MSMQADLPGPSFSQHWCGTERHVLNPDVTSPVTVSTSHSVTPQQGSFTGQLTEQTIWAFLQKLPTREDFESLASRVEMAVTNMQTAHAEITDQVTFG